MSYTQYPRPVKFAFFSQGLNSTGEGLEHHCKLDESLVLKASPYLFPCTIEYSIIAAAILYKIFLNVGRLNIAAAEKHEPSVSVTECHKANKGLFVGLFVLIATTISVATFFVFEESDSNTGQPATTVFFATELGLLVLATIIIITNFIIFQQLKFEAKREGQHNLDVNLLVVGLFGVCVFNVFLMVASSVNFNAYGTIGYMSFAAALLGFSQAVLQTLFILDGLRRSAHNKSQVENKPGRALVTCLLLCNLSLWVVNTFEVKKADSIEINYSHYGYLSWSIISHMSIPLLIFYRFHSTVCLSEIWIKAYDINMRKNG